LCGEYYKSEPEETIGDKREPFSFQIDRLLEQTQGNLNYINNRLLEINGNLLPPSVLPKTETMEEKQRKPQGWFQKVIAKLNNIHSKSDDIKRQIDLLSYEVINKK